MKSAEAGNYNWKELNRIEAQWRKGRGLPCGRLNAMEVPKPRRKRTPEERQNDSLNGLLVKRGPDWMMKNHPEWYAMHLRNSRDVGQS